MMKKLGLVLAVAAAATLVACGGGGGTQIPAPVVIATSNPTVDVGAPLAAALVNQTFSFPAAVPALGTTAATSVTFTDTSATPAVRVASGNFAATGTTTFGSCIMRFVISNFPVGQGPQVGQTITVNLCTITPSISGRVANGTPANTNLSLNFGGLASAPVSVPVVVNPNGAVVVNGAPAGSTTTGNATGG